MSIKATTINCNNILKEKYGVSIFDQDPLIVHVYFDSSSNVHEYFDVESLYDDLGNNWWSYIWKVGDRYFKFHGLNGFMDEDCHEMIKRTELREFVSWDYKGDDTQPEEDLQYLFNLH
jgi:hypothetical protein